MSWSADIPVARAESRYFRVQRPGAEACGIIADIRAHFDSKVVTLRSCVQVGPPGADVGCLSLLYSSRSFSILC